MATVRTNPLVNDLSGMLGSIVFKTYGGNTIVTGKPRLPQTQSTQQKANRSKFREATHWAKAILLNPERKEYYQKKAKKLKLPNAYTAAITDFMRKPKLTTRINTDKIMSCSISKRDFDVKKVEVNSYDATGAISETRVITKNIYNEWSFRLSETDRGNVVEIRVTDDAGRVVRFEVN